MQNNYLFELNGIGQSAHQVTIIDDVTLNIQSGEFLALLGSSGSGKTTLLRLFNGLDSPSKGMISYRGKSVDLWQRPLLRQQVGMVFQEPVILAGSVRENLLLHQRWDKNFQPLMDLDLFATLEKVGLQEISLESDARSLSGGEKQRLSLARVLLNQPQVLLLDEPTANLDPRLSRQIINRIAELRRDMNLTVVMVSHDPDLIRRHATRVVFMEGGKIIEIGTGEILETPATKELSHYLAEEH